MKKLTLLVWLLPGLALAQSNNADQIFWNPVTTLFNVLFKGGSLTRSIPDVTQFSTTSCSVIRNSGSGTLSPTTCSEFCSKIGHQVSCTLNVTFTLTGAQSGTFNISGGYAFSGSAFTPARGQFFTLPPDQSGQSACWTLNPDSAGNQIFYTSSCATGAQIAPSAGTNYNPIWNMTWTTF